MRSIILRKIAGRLEPLWQSSGGPSFGPGDTSANGFLTSTFGMILMTAVLVAVMWVLSHGGFHPQALALGGFGLAGVTGDAVPLKKKKEQFAALLKELEAGQKKISETGLTQPEGEALEAKAKEAETLQKEIETAERVDRLIAAGREVDDPTLPEGKRRQSPTDEEKSENEVVGYISVGNLFVNSPEYKDFLERGAPTGPGSGSAPMAIQSLRDRFVPVTRKMRRGFEAVEAKAKAEHKAIPTLTTAVIQRDRITEVVRTTEPFRLRMRDVLNVSSTDSNMVEYLQITASVDVAAPTAENTAKPERTMSIDAVTAPVRTLAVWMPITEQQLSDAPQLQGIVDNELLFDLARLEEKQFLYGSGAGENLQGLLTLAGVPSVTRLAPGDPGIATQNVDRIRIAITDVMIAGGDPNGLVIHPLDWENVVLQKGTDARYIWAVIDTGNGPRIWGLSVVETTATLKPAATERNFLVGDFIRGATVWDRQQASVAIGFVNDDFIKNRRTIRGEERLAFGIKRPTFFEKYKTAA